MKRVVAVTIACLMLLCCSGRDGFEGPPGPPGPQGFIGPQGAPGISPVIEGSRLKTAYIYGEDGARGITDWWFDQQREELCRFQPVGLQEPKMLRCMPQVEETTGFQTWALPNCAGVPATTIPEATLIRTKLDGLLFEQTEHTYEIYVKIPGPEGPCILWQNEDYPPPYVRWKAVSPLVFVPGEVDR